MIPPVRLPDKTTSELYRDLLQPLARKMGSDLADTYDALRDAFLKVVRNPEYRPVAERLAAFLDEAIEPVPIQRREIAPLQILGPALEGALFAPPGSDLDKALVRLLTAAFDRERVGKAHPAFPGLVRAMADDELALVSLLRNRSYDFPLASGDIHGVVRESTLEEQTRPFPELKIPNQIRVYLTHLESLGIIDDLYPVGGPKFVNNNYWNVVHWKVTLSDFGIMFAETMVEAPKW